MGHGISVMILGVAAFFVKGQVSQLGSFQTVLSKASSVTEIAVGLSLIVIGLLGMKEAREWEAEIDGVQPQSLSAAAADPGIKTSQKQRAVVFNGLLHGFSWDGAPSLAPALAVATWRGNLAFLLAYAFGTIGVMTVATTVIGEGTRRAGEVFHRPDIPQKLSFFSSILAVAIGLLWCGMAVAN
jgi:sulfite exporter TauE/SafE